MLSLVLTGEGERRRVLAFDYYVAPVPRDGSCSGHVKDLASWKPFQNTTVALRHSSHPPKYVLGFQTMSA